MKSTILTGVLSLMAFAGMTAAAHAQFPIARGIARTAVRGAATAVDVNVNPGVVVATPGVMVTRPGLAVTRSVTVSRPWLAGLAATTATASVANTAAASTSVVANNAATYTTQTDCCGNTVYSSGSAAYGGSASYSSGAAVTSSVVAQTAPVQATTTVTRSVLARPVVGWGYGLGAGVNVATPRVGVTVAR
jgi:hypothetical protein